jgi:nucleoid DNA-binding protein
MDISPYFIELLEEKNQVTIPGLGKFFKKRIPGYYHQESKSYFPPSGVIAFTSEYLHDDKLVHLISLKNNSSLTSAYAILDEYLRDIKNTLKTDILNLEGIGILKSDDGKLSLESTPSANLDTASFGLPEIDTQSELLLGTDQETYSLAQQALSTAMPDEEMVEEKRSVTSLVFMIIAVAILASLAGLYFAKPDIYKNLINQVQQNFAKKPEPPKEKVALPAASVEELTKADSIYNSASDDVEANLRAQGFDDIEKTKDSANVIVKTKILPKAGGFRYEIIIGLYSLKEDAVTRAQQLRSYGIDARVLEEDKDGPMIKITGATLYDDNAAEKELKRIQKEINPQAFKKAYKILK